MNRIEQLIEDYFSNSLTEKEAGELRELLGKDTEAAADFAFQQRIAGQLRTQNLWKTEKEQLTASYQPGTATTTSATILRFPMLMRIAAALTVVIAATWFAISYFGKQPLEQVVAENIQPMKAVKDWGTLGAGTPLPPDEIKKAYDLYDAGQYAAAADLFAQVVPQEPDNLGHRLYYGICLLKVKRYPDAAGTLEPVTRADGKYYRLKTPALYYYGLALAGSGDKAKAREVLERYIDTKDDDTPYSKQAKNVIDAL